MGRMVASLHIKYVCRWRQRFYSEHLSSNNLTEDQRCQFSRKLKIRPHDLEHHVNDMLLFAKSGQQSTLADVDADDLMNIPNKVSNIRARSSY